ncbi:MAG: hypothetical protein IKN74_02485 [Clostridia bacterium]|nr:hypothetical protein [Clostridia bacterium]
MDTHENRAEEVLNIYNESENKIKSDAIISRALADKITTEAIDEKVDAQLNSIKVQIHEINPNFKDDKKYYEIAKQTIQDSMKRYEDNLLTLSKPFDDQIEKLILEKAEIETSIAGDFLAENYLKENHENSEEENKKKVSKESKERIKEIDKKIKDLNDQKDEAIRKAMEEGNGAIQVNVKKIKVFKKIKRFFMVKLNSYKVIVKDVINPFNERIDKFNVS